MTKIKVYTKLIFGVLVRCTAIGVGVGVAVLYSEQLMHPEEWF
jgi:hypothetical protein